MIIVILLLCVIITLLIYIGAEVEQINKKMKP